MKKKLKDELENKNTVQEYICPNCGKRYNALDALRLISVEDEYFHCENCNGELVAESDNLAVQEIGDGDDNARRRRREKLKDMLQKLEVQLKPVMEQLSRVKDMAVPEFGTLQAWEARVRAQGCSVNSDSSTNDYSKSSQGLGYGGTPMPFVGETKVEVAFSGVEVKEEDTKSEVNMKVLPPWMIKEGMNLTKEQRGDVKQELKMDGSSTPAGFSDDKKSGVEKDDEKKIQDEYVKAYYNAILQRQLGAVKQEQNITDATAGESGTSDRKVGMKSKRDEVEGDENVEWEEAPPAPVNTNAAYKVDLNVQADETSGDDDDDDIEWEEG